LLLSHSKETEDAFAVVDYGQKKPKTYSRSRYNPTRAVRRYPTQPAVMHDRHYAKQLASGHSRKRGVLQRSCLMRLIELLQGNSRNLGAIKRATKDRGIGLKSARKPRSRGWRQRRSQCSLTGR
jgi:hypothetical protein